MLRSLVRSAQHVRRPMIKFPDRTQAQDPQKPHPHPAAPQAVIDDFKHFQDVFKSGPHFNPDKLESQAQSHARQETGMGKQASGGTGGSGGEVYEDIHDLPPRFWKKPSAEMGQAEMDAIMSGGATLLQ
ncbi:unnamed protein product [Jaminaea pallidilutea]